MATEIPDGTAPPPGDGGGSDPQTAPDDDELEIEIDAGSPDDDLPGAGGVDLPTGLINLDPDLTGATDERGLSATEPARGSTQHGIAVPVDEGDGEAMALDLDDVEMLDAGDIEMLDADEPLAPAPARPETRIGPPPPPPVPRPPRTPPAAAAEVSDDSETIDASAPDDDDFHVAEVPGDAELEERRAEIAAAVAERPELRGLEIPTVIDRMLERRGDAAKLLAKELSAGFDRVLGPDRKAEIAYELGELAARMLGDPDRARRAHQRSAEADPSLRSNLWSLRRLQAEAGDWDAVLAALELELPFARGDRERADLLVEKADVLADRLDRGSEAKQALEEAFADDESCVAAVVGLERVAVREGDEDRRAELLRAYAATAEHPVRKAHFLIELAELLANQGDLRITEALEVAQEAAQLGVESSRVGRLRERLGENADDWSAALHGLEQQVEAELARFGPAGPPTPQPRDQGQRPDAADEARGTIVALRRRQSRIARQHLEDDAKAWDYLQQALVLQPNEPLLLADLADLAERLGKYEELAELCAGWESQEADPLRSLSLSVRRAEALLHGDHRDEAGRLLQSLAATAPGYLPVAALLERDAIARMDWSALASAYAQMAEAAALGGAFSPGAGEHIDKPGAAGLYTAAGDLMASPAVEDYQAAVAYYSRALELVPGYPPAVEAAVALRERYGQLEDAAAVLELQSETEDEAARFDYLQRLVRLYQDLGQFEDQAGVLRRLIELRPGDLSLRFRLEELLGDLGKLEQRGVVLIDIADTETDPPRQAAALVEAGRVHEFDLRDLERASGLYERALDLAPDDPYTVEALLSVYRQLGKWVELVALQRKRAETMADGPGLSRALREAAEISRLELDDPKAAATIYRELCDRVPDDDLALHGLALCLRGSGDDGEIAVLEQLAELRTEPAARASALLALAARMEEQGDATDIYKQVAEVMPESAHGTVAMAASTRSGGAAALFADAVGELRDHRADTALRARLSEQAGWTWLLELGDPERADAEFLTAATADPTHPGPRLGLVLSRAKLGDPTSHAAALADLGASMNSGHVAASLLMRAAVASQVEGEPDTASRIAAAQRLSPDDGAVVTVAAEYPLQVHDFEPEVAAQLLAERAELLTTRAALAESEDDRDSWELDAADALERAGQLGRATELVVEVLRTRPDDVRAIRTLRKLCERGDDRAGYARATVSLAAVLGDGHAKIDLWREAGLVLDDELGDVRSAVPIYRRILQIDPDAGEYSRLLEIYREHGDRAGVYELLSQRLNRAQIRGKAGEQLDLLMQRAELREELGDIRGASRDLARLLTLEPRHGDALSRQSQLLVRLGQEQAAAKALELYLEVEEDAEKRGEAEIMLSQLLAESLEDFTGAIVQLEHVLLDNDDDAVRDRLITYMIRSEKWDQAIAELSKAASQRETDRERARDFLRIAEIHRRHRGNAAAAHAALERARQYDPLHIETIRELADLVGEVRDLPTRNRVLRSACRDLRAAIGEQPSRVPLYERLAVVNRWLGEPEGQFFALCAYQELRSLSPEQTAFVDEMRPLMSRAPDDIGEPMTPDEWRNRLVHPQFSGVASELWITLGRALDELRGHSPDSLGFGRGTRVSPKLIEQHHPVVANVLSAFGVAGIDVHVSADKTQTARVVGHDKPKLLLSADVAAGNNAACLFLLGRAVAQARDRTSPLYELTDADIRYYFAAAARLAGLDRLPTEVGELTAGSDDDELERYVRVLGKKLSRADRRALATAASGFSELGDPATWRHAALVSGARAGMLLCGDLQVAMDVVDIGRGGRVVVDDPDGLQLFSWTVSADHLLLRAKLGLRKTPGEGRS